MMTGPVGNHWLPRGRVIFLAGMVVSLLVAGSFVLFHPAFLPGSRAGAPDETPRLREEIEGQVNLSSLNVRLSTRPIHPPDGLVRRTVVLPGVRGARPLYGEPIRAAILEDDARRRVVILSTDGQDGATGHVRAQLLHDFDLERYLPAVTACSAARRCALDRTPATGGLACVAMCLVEALRS